MNNQETVLATIPGSNDSDRLVVVLRQDAGVSRIELRQQSYGMGVGWFTQSSVQVEPAQLAELRQVLGGSNAAGTRAGRTVRPSTFVPRVIHAESA